jgi:hypothetical protein
MVHERRALLIVIYVCTIKPEASDHTGGHRVISFFKIKKKKGQEKKCGSLSSCAKVTGKLRRQP